MLPDLDMHGDATETVDPEELASAPDVLARGSVVSSRYEIEELIGSGGFSHVYAAIDRALGDRIAIKILRSDRVTSSTLSRLRREVSLTREIPRSTLVRVFDLGQDGASTFLTMELIRGETLRDRIARGPLSVDETVRIAEQILDALGGLHEAGVVHRDVKPANILLTPDGGAKLADFGLVRLWESGEKVTRTEAFVGTLEYVAPEQAIGGRLDGRTDLYSFGVLLFEMLAGRLPHEGTTNIGKVVAHLTSAAPDIRSVAPGVPVWLAELIQRLMEKDPANRPATAAVALESMRLRKRDLRWRLRRKRAGAVAGAVLLAAAIASGIWGWNDWHGAFDHLEGDVSNGLRAIDRTGRTLWSSAELVPGSTAALVRLDGRTLAVAGVPHGLVGARSIDEVHRLGLRDPRTGVVMNEIALVHAADAFALAPTFVATTMVAVDPEHDGRDDLVVTYTHSPYWPSYSIYVDPRHAESAPILVASGHHRPAGAADIDGDGVDELFFVGPNNRMGRFTGVAAVRVMRADTADRVSSAWIGASTPDAEYRHGARDPMVWYSLQPRFSAYACGLTVADGKARVLRFTCGAGTSFELDYDGFAPGTSSRLDPATRREARARAYAELREAIRLGATSQFAEAVDRVSLAADTASAAGDILLSEWVETNAAILLARAGRAPEAETRFLRLVETTASPWQICLQAGRVFESVGDLGRAARFLRLGVSTPSSSVWDKPELTSLLEALVLVLAQQEKWEEAREMTSTYSEAFYETTHIVAILDAFIGWRTGSPATHDLPLNPAAPGAYDYWAFETRWARGGEDPAALRDEMNAFRTRRPDPDYLYHSLEAEILFRLGRTDEAKALAKRALAETRDAAKQEMLARAHLPVVEERAAQLR